jgi:hypothetical protein
MEKGRLEIPGAAERSRSRCRSVGRCPEILCCGGRRDQEGRDSRCGQTEMFAESIEPRLPGIVHCSLPM